MTIHPTVIHRYQVVELIGQGGMGAVYLARDPALGRLVALKLLRTDLDSDVLRERFLREARAAASLSHVNIVAVFDVGEHQGQPFIAMEYIKGETVRDLLARGVELPLVRRLHFMKDLCAGLAHAHRVGIVHRDIKPGNLIVTAEQVLKILDFGIARVRDSSITQVGALMGTLSYMSPEQSFGLAVDHRTDVFSVGAVFYELLAGRKAFPGQIEDGVLHRIQFEAPTPLESIVPGLDPNIVRIVGKALEKEKTRRYDDLSVMRRDIIKVLREVEEHRGEDSTRVLLSALPPSATPTPGPAPSAPSGGRAGDLEIFARRRAAEIESRLQAARAAQAAGDHEAAVAACEEALFLDPDNAEADRVRQHARAELLAREVRRTIGEARDHLDRGSLTSAGLLLDRAVELDPGSPDAAALRLEIERVRQERELARQRQAAIDEFLGRAKAAWNEGRAEDALAEADRVLGLDAGSEAAGDIRRRAAAVIEEAHRREAHDREAAGAVASANERFDGGDHAGALAMLAAFRPPHGVVSQALDELAQRAKRIEEEQRAAAAQAERVAALAREAHDRAAAEAVGSARRLFEAGDHTRALAALSAFRPPHDLVSQAAVELAGRVSLIDAEQRRAEQERVNRERSVLALVGRARTALSEARFDDAFTIVDRIRGIDPASAQAQALAAEAEEAREAARRREAHEEARRLDEAQRVAEQRAAEQSWAERQREAQQADEDQRRAVRERVETERRLLALVVSARSALGHGRLDEAIDLVRQIREAAPDAGEADALTSHIEAERARLKAAQDAALAADRAVSDHTVPDNPAKAEFHDSSDAPVIGPAPSAARDTLADITLAPGPTHPAAPPRRVGPPHPAAESPTPPLALASFEAEADSPSTTPARRLAVIGGVVVMLAVAGWWILSRPSSPAPTRNAVATGAAPAVANDAGGPVVPAAPKTPAGQASGRVGGAVQPGPGRALGSASAITAVAGRLLAGGDKEAALAQLAAGLEKYPADSGLREMLDGLRAAALLEVREARGAAIGAEKSASYQEASALLYDRSRRTPADEVRAYWNAKRLFDQAGAAARAGAGHAATPEKPVAGPAPPPQAPSTVPATATALSQPRPDSAAGEARPAMPPEDERAIRLLLERWRRLMEGSSTAELRKIAELSPDQIRGIENFFITYRLRTFTLLVLSISPTSDGAAARCQVRQTLRGDGSQVPRELDSFFTFRLARRPEWRIVSMPGF
jgi:predicted Ser/Thr protein kinase